MSEKEPVVLVVEDDTAIADLVELYLRRDGYRVYQAANGEDALRTFRDRQPSLVILDVGLPGGMNGIDICKALRQMSDVPVIMLTARDAEIDRVLGLEMGADDYVVKPFSPRELAARVKALLRRASGPTRAASRVLQLGSIVVDLDRRETMRNGVAVPLATREFELLAYLAENQGLALSRQQLLDGVWGAGWIGDERTVDVHVRQLRKKLGDEFELATVWGVGYRLG